MGDDLRRAIYNLQNGKDMTYRQEFALQCLWHEAMHSQSPWTRGLKGATYLQQEVMESVNEFCASMTLGNFITRLGGNSKYSDRIIRETPNYSSAGLVKELRDSRIPLNVAYHELHKIHTTTSNARTYKSAVYSKLKELGVKDPDKIFV